MARERSPNRAKAFEMWKDSQGTMLLKEIADRLGVSDSLVRKWKKTDDWEAHLNGYVTNGNSYVTNESKGHVPNQRGAPKGNKNAVGNKGGRGAPKENQYAVGNSGGRAPKGNGNAVTHGLFRKFLPEETLEIMEQLETKSPLDMLWDNIMIQYTAIIRAQHIMFVQDQDDRTEVLKRQKVTDTGWEKEWDLQHAWDKQATFLQAQSRAMATLQSMISRYEDLCRQGTADEEQQLRIEKLKAEVKAIENNKGVDTSSGLDQLTEAIQDSVRAVGEPT